ncbi:MAG: carboxypeptidase-like regulatory domain-containing protein [Vicinamibacterales bacterium]
MRHLVLRAAVAVMLSAGVAVMGARAAAGVVVSGTVSGSDQGFLTGALVVLDGAQRRETHTDADGRFTFVDVPRGRHRFVASADGYLPMDRPMDVGDVSVSLDVVLLRLPGLQ